MSCVARRCSLLRLFWAPMCIQLFNSKWESLPLHDISFFSKTSRALQQCFLFWKPLNVFDLLSFVLRFMGSWGFFHGRYVLMQWCRKRDHAFLEDDNKDINHTSTRLKHILYIQSQGMKKTPEGCIKLWPFEQDLDRVGRETRTLPPRAQHLELGRQTLAG